MFTGSSSEISLKICWRVIAHNLGLEIPFALPFDSKLAEIFPYDLRKIQGVFASGIDAEDDIKPILAQGISASMLVGQSCDDEVHECGPESRYNRFLEIFGLVVLGVPDVV